MLLKEPFFHPQDKETNTIMQWREANNQEL